MQDLFSHGYTSHIPPPYTEFCVQSYSKEFSLHKIVQSKPKTFKISFCFKFPVNWVDFKGYQCEYAVKISHYSLVRKI